MLALIASGSLILPMAQAMEKPAHGHDRMAMQFDGKQLHRMQKLLALTDDQVNEIKAINTESRTQAKALHESAKAFREQVKAEQTSDVFNEALFTETYNQYQETFAKLALNRAKSRHAIFNVLTLEQQAKWQEVLASRKGMRRP